MRIRLEHDGTVFEFERTPMPPERFNALCKLAGGAISGAVLLGAVRMVGFNAIVAAVVCLVLVGFGKMGKWMCD